MLRILLRRLPLMLPVLFLVSILTFSLVHVMPGDPAIALAGETATAEEVDQVRREMGLNRALPVQYVDWIGDVVRGDLGTSLYNSQDVGPVLWERLPATFSLTLGAVVIALLLGLPMGVIAGLRRGSWVDRLATFGSTIGISMPSFWLGLLLLLAFALYNPWLPATGYVGFSEGPIDWVRHLVLPSLTLSAPLLAEIARQARSSVGDVLDLDYIRTARAKGLPEVRVVGKHVSKNAAIPVVTVLGMQIGRLLGGTIVIETVFGIPGLGSLAVESVSRQDMPIIQGVVLLTALFVVMTNLVVDMTYGYFNPKVAQS